MESTQLHSREAIIKWATLLAAVAARAIRLAYLGRTSPEVPAKLQFTDDEITAAFILSKRKRDRRRIASLGEMIGIIGEQGVFAGQYSGHPPGPTLLARGLIRVQLLAEALRNMRKM